MIRNLLASAAAASLALGAVFAPATALANTRAGEARVAFDAPALLQRVAAPIGAFQRQGDDDDEISTLLVALLFGAASAAIIIAVESTENQKSPGT